MPRTVSALPLTRKLTIVMDMKACTTCKQEKGIDHFYLQKGHPLDRMSSCKPCFNKKCCQRWVRLKVEAINAKGGKCSRCSLSLSDSHYSVFEFHHNNPVEKDFDWNKMRLASKERRDKELIKCTLLCANCHRIVHSEDFPEQ